MICLLYKVRCCSDLGIAEPLYIMDQKPELRVNNKNTSLKLFVVNLEDRGGDSFPRIFSFFLFLIVRNFM